MPARGHLPVAFTIRPLTDRDRPWAARLLSARWGSTRMVTRGRLFDAGALPGFYATIEDVPSGLVTYHLARGECEITTLDSLREGLGIGTALLAAVERAAREAGSRRLWLITTNDNLHALRFYQRRGYTLAALYPDALAESRRLKPEIPLLGLAGIPLRDEIELEKRLAAGDRPARA